MMNVLCEMDSLKDANTELELDIRKLKGELRRREEKERRIEESRKELDFYKRENDLLRKDLESANEENAQLRVLLKKQETTLMDIKKKSKEEELQHAEQLEKANNLEYELEEMAKENMRLKESLLDLNEKATVERKYRSELERIKLNLLSVRNSEVEKLNSMFESLIRTQDQNHRTPASKHAGKSSYQESE